MFGGKDFVYENISGPSAREVALGLLRSEWPDGVLVDPNSDSAEPFPIADARALTAQELLVFKSREAEREWDEHGLPVGLEDTMVMLFTEDREVTLVAAREALASPVVSSLCKTLSDLWRMQRAPRLAA